jgi:hypothetical protein
MGEGGAASKRLEEIAAEARRTGLKVYELEALLALGELERRSARAAAGRARLRAVEAEARALGLNLVARRASASAG